MLIAKFITGSRQYGTQVSGSDTDMLTVSFSPPSNLLGNSYLKPKHKVYSQGMDITKITLNHLFSWLSKGSPNAIELLHIRPVEATEYWNDVLAIKDVFVTARVISSAIGMAKARWKANTPKHNMHSLRVLQQTLELVNHGNITFPRPNSVELLAIRNGEVCSHSEIESSIEKLKGKIKTLPNNVAQTAKDKLVTMNYNYLKSVFD